MVSAFVSPQVALLIHFPFLLWYVEEHACGVCVCVCMGKEEGASCVLFRIKLGNSYSDQTAFYDSGALLLL